MLRAPRRRSPRVPLLAVALWGAGALGCNASPVPPQRVAPAAGDQASAEAGAPAEPAAPAEPEAERPPPLTEEDLALLAADPKDLTPELRRKRAYARRRQIMQNPDSPTARALRDLAEAHRAGEIDVERRDGVWFSLPGSKPAGGRPPAGYRPPAEGSAAAPAPAPADAPAPTETPTPAVDPAAAPSPSAP